MRKIEFFETDKQRFVSIHASVFQLFQSQGLVTCISCTVSPDGKPVENFALKENPGMILLRRIQIRADRFAHQMDVDWYVEKSKREMHATVGKILQNGIHGAYANTKPFPRALIAVQFKKETIK